jgi:two-component system sensor histidine kinase DesK
MPTTDHVSDAISKQRSQKWAWIWMAYTGFLFITPVIEPSRALWIGTLSVFFLFVFIMWGYIRATDDGHPLRFSLIGATFLLGLAAFPWNQGASCLFAYAAAFIPFSVVSVRRVLSIQAAILLSIFAEGFLFHARHDAFHISWANTYIAIFITVVVGGGNIFFAQQRRADCLLRAAQEENVTLAAVAERERIARDLHDVLGHTLSVIVLKAELAGRLLSHPTAADPLRAAAEIADVERTARTALAEVREAIGGYRSQGLAAEIEAAQRVLDAANVRLIVDTENATSAGLSAAEETVLALSLREAVTNIVRHAQATTCKLRFITPDGLQHGRRRLVIEDNGHHAATREGNGLRGMRERVESLGGHLSLERGNAGTSDLARGTRILIDLPAHSEAA